VPDGAFYLYPSCSGAIGKVTPEGKTIASISTSSSISSTGWVASVHGSGYGLSPYFRLSTRDIDGDDQGGVRPHREGLLRSALRLPSAPADSALFSCVIAIVFDYTAKRRAMSVDFTKLKSFVKIVDAGKRFFRAASILRNLSARAIQQVAALETIQTQASHAQQYRDDATEAGLVLYDMLSCC